MKLMKSRAERTIFPFIERDFLWTQHPASLKYEFVLREKTARVAFFSTKDTKKMFHHS